MSEKRTIGPKLDPDYFRAVSDRLGMTYPRVVGNALVCSDGSTHQLRVLEKLYLACGIVTVAELNERYRADRPRQGA